MEKGNIEQRGKNSWRLTVELGYDAQGERDFERKTIRVKDPELQRAPRRLQNHLDEELVKFKMEIESGHYIRPEKLTFSKFRSGLPNSWRMSLRRKRKSVISSTLSAGFFPTSTKTMVMPICAFFS
ncbi:hypothetical protein PaeBR_15230 [Paenibacillus sp. BR2-3]|uniref:hypothetical protein n=1 Tax=Paenibacillus sp. BR2-3 TaxID=3048494 RepID=UPI0039773921